MTPEPFLRFFVIPELLFLPAETLIVVGSKNVMQVFVVDDRFHEEVRHIGSIEPWMNPDHSGIAVVGTETNAVAFSAADALAPANDGTAPLGEPVGKIVALDLGGENLQVVVGN